MSNRVIHFEIPSDDLEKSTAFYNKIFGWKFTQFGNQEYWLATTGNDNEPGINGAIMKKKHPDQPFTSTIKVDNIEATIQSIENEGGKIVVPKMPIPGVGWLLFFKDLDNNIFGVMQDDTTLQ